MATNITKVLPNLIMLMLHMVGYITLESGRIVTLGAFELLVLHLCVHSLDVLIQSPPEDCCIITLIALELFVFLFSMLPFDVRVQVLLIGGRISALVTLENIVFGVLMLSFDVIG